MTLGTTLSETLQDMLDWNQDQNNSDAYLATLSTARHCIELKVE
jgi:hypothetical protein